MSIKVVDHPEKQGEYAIHDASGDVYFLSPSGEIVHTQKRDWAEKIVVMWEAGTAAAVKDQPRRLELYKRKNERI